MLNIGRTISKVLFTGGVVFVAVSIYSFWSAHQIKQQQVQRAGDDPFGMVFSDKIQTPNAETGNAEMIKLNNQRLRSENKRMVSND